MTDKPTVSVVIPCYNAGPFLRETLDSAINQTYPPLEILVIDDGSTDDSAAIAESYGPPVRVIRQPNQGESVARNRGIDEAKGDWIAFLDADDVWEPRKLATCVSTIRTSPNSVICVYTDHYRFGSGVPRLDVERPELHEREYPVAEMLIDWCIQPSTALVHNKAARAVRFPEETRDSEDMIFFAHLRSRGQVVRVPIPLSGYRSSPQQQTRSSWHMYRSIFSRITWAKKNPAAIPSHELEILLTRLVPAIEDIFTGAYWSRNWALARAARSLFLDNFPDAPLPQSMRRRLWPLLLVRIKDAIDRMLHDKRPEYASQTTVLPQR